LGKGPTNGKLQKEKCIRVPRKIMQVIKIYDKILRGTVTIKKKPVYVD